MSLNPQCRDLIEAATDGASFDGDEELVKDGDALLGSLVFTRDAKYHEPLGPLVAK